MARIGDIFAVRDGDALIGVLHYLARDPTQLQSHVVAAFSISPLTSLGVAVQAISDTPAFYTHVALPVGVKHGVFERIGFRAASRVPEISFRICNDYGHNGQATSADWSIWSVGAPMKRMARLSGEQRRYEIGMVINPFSVVNRLKSGSWDFVYPEPA